MNSHPIFENMIVDLEHFGGAIPALEGPPTAALLSYVFAMPGNQLADIYEAYGDRLLDKLCPCLLKPL